MSRVLDINRRDKLIVSEKAAVSRRYCENGWPTLKVGEVVKVPPALLISGCLCECGPLSEDSFIFRKLLGTGGQPV